MSEEAPEIQTAKDLHDVMSMYCTIQLQWLEEVYPILTSTIEPEESEQEKLSALRQESEDLTEAIFNLHLERIPREFYCSHVRSLLLFASFLTDCRAYEEGMRQMEGFMESFTRAMILNEMDIMLDTMNGWLKELEIEHVEMP